MGGRSSRTKGHAFEREIAQRLRPYDSSARRNVAETQIASVDIITKLPFGIQCKRMREWPNPLNVIRQAREGIGEQDGIIPTGIVKVDFEHRTVVFMQLRHFQIFFEDMLKRKAIVFKRRPYSPRKKRCKPLERKSFRPGKKKVSPYTLLTECFMDCLPGQEPVALWRRLYRERGQTYAYKHTVLACFDLELFLNQIAKVYGKEENRNYKL